jgi:TolA-binding protein
MKRNLRRSLGLPALALLVVGCASRGEIEAFQTDLVQIQEQLAAVGRRQAAQDSLLVSRVERLRERLLETEAVLRSLKADQQQGMEELGALIGTVRATLDDAGVHNRRLAQKIDELNLILARQGLRQERDELAGADPEWLFNQANLDLWRGFPELARAGFREYLARFPEGPQASACSYWIADTWISEQQPDSAWNQLLRFETAWPEDPRLPASLLRRALIAAGRGEEAPARELLGEVLLRWPESAEARLARERLREPVPTP